MSCCVVYPLLFLLFSCVWMSEVQQEEHRNKTESTEHLDVEESDAALTSAEFQENFLREIYTELKTLKARQEVTEEQLRRTVAFSATLGPIGNLGPFNTDITVVFRKVFVNEGGAYNPTTGIFTAPVKGIYFFTIGGLYQPSKAMVLDLMKNGQKVLSVYKSSKAKHYDSGSRSVSLNLEKGDHVYIQLRSKTWIYDDVNVHSIFSGHLLFSPPITKAYVLPADALPATTQH